MIWRVRLCSACQQSCLCGCRYGISPESIILYGQSIGTVPTVDLASRYECAAVVLHSPLTSGMRVAFPDTKKTYCFDAFPKWVSPPSVLVLTSDLFTVFMTVLECALLFPNFTLSLTRGSQFYLCFSSCIYKRFWFRLEAHLGGLWWDVTYTHTRFSAVLLGLSASCPDDITELLQQYTVTALYSWMLSTHKLSCLSAQVMCFPAFCSNIPSLCYRGAVPHLCVVVVWVLIVLYVLFLHHYGVLSLQCTSAAVCTFCCQGGFNNSISGRSGEARDSFNSLIPDGTSGGRDQRKPRCWFSGLRNGSLCCYS